MKSLLQIDKRDLDRIKKFAEAETRKMSETHIKLVFKIVALELYKLYGFGRVRTLKLLTEVEKDLQRIGDDYGLDCVMTKLDDELKRIGVVDDEGNWNAM